MFRDREEAGQLLGEELAERGYGPDVIVLGIPRGGVVVAARVASVLGARLDIVAAAKVGAPGNPEYGIGAVAPDGEVVAGRGGYSAAHVTADSGPALAKVRHEIAEFRGGREALEIAGLTAIIVDDGLATGLTALAAVQYVRRQGAARVVLAVPVAATDSVRALSAHADEVVVLDVPEWFQAVGQFYRVFGQTEDAEVSALLEANRRARPA
jgi:predicted phosphoribosyltransferase